MSGEVEDVLLRMKLEELKFWAAQARAWQRLNFVMAIGTAALIVFAAIVLAVSWS